jgi:hypothetical protein
MKDRRQSERVGAAHEVGGQNFLNSVEFSQHAYRDGKRSVSVYDADLSRTVVNYCMVYFPLTQSR